MTVIRATGHLSTNQEAYMMGQLSLLLSYYVLAKILSFKLILNVCNESILLGSIFWMHALITNSEVFVGI